MGFKSGPLFKEILDDVKHRYFTGKLQDREAIKNYVLKKYMTKVLDITGIDVMKLLDVKPGRQVGEALEKAAEAVSSGAIPNKKQSIVDYLRETFGQYS